MSYTIAITGKGGTGKTTIAALLVANLVRRGKRPVLAVDADPNSCLDLALGVKAANTVGRLREDARDLAAANPALSKRELLEMKISESLVEGDDFDLIAMGRPEGPGCYCYANNVLRDVLAEISGSYPYVVLDNEAGLENLSRRIVTRVDLLLVAGDTSRNGLETIRRVHGLSREMGISFGKLGIIVNRVRREGEGDTYSSLKTALAAEYLITLPYDDALLDWNERGESLMTLPDDNPVNRAIGAFISELSL
ncbi:MAG: AAA family ATPase [Spirochaetes bacterium]|nr:AAA family ATPase [Spirochaetota bacterium]